jgi:DNA polymerase-3 subunit alpha
LKKSSIPFVGLHAHSVAGSPFDALGYPQDHMDYAYENGCEALALTDHGNMNGMAYQVLHAKKMKAEGKDFKPIFGVEAYFIPSLEAWNQERDKAKEDKKRASELKDSTTMSVENEGETKRSKSILNQRSHLVLLAQNQTGLNNIFAMISKSNSDEYFFRYPRVDYEVLKEHSEGVIASSACMGGVYAANFWKFWDGENEVVTDPEACLDAFRDTTRKMVDIFGDRWYGELQWHTDKKQHMINKLVIQMHKEFGIKLISTADSHYPSQEAWKDRELYKRLGFLGKGKPDWLSNELPESVAEVGYELYPKNGDQMWESYKHYSEMNNETYDDDLIMDSITETHNIAFNRIEEFMPDNEVRLPSFVVPDGYTADAALETTSLESLNKLGLLTNPEYKTRLEEELSVISDRGFSKYFLTMKAIADTATENQLAGPGRGSAAGSLVAYALGITQVDPIKYGLQFARFLRKDATDYPDIDYDVSNPMQLKEIMQEKWGDTTVVPISNFNTLQLKSLVKDISKLYDIPFTEANAVTSRMISEATPKAKAKHGIKSGVYVPTFDELMEFSDSLQNYLSKYPHIKTHIESLYGQVRSTSRHAGGVVVGEDLDKHMPLIRSGGVLQTPWSEGMNVRHLEPLGFIKFDVLGLASLRMVETAVRHILKRHYNNPNPTFKDVRDYYDEYLHPDKINLNDSKVYKNIFHKGKWAGIFQFTESGAQNFCKQAKPKNIIDISAITSIYRPGPLGANVDKKYVKAKESPKDIFYANKQVKDVTKETYGFLIFQEQIASLAHQLGEDISLDEGNLLRKLLTKKGTGKGAEHKEQIRKKFVKGCVNKKMTEDQANGLWSTFEYFSGYGFNKSHAVSYSILSFQCAWLLNYYPAEWMAAFLDKEPDSRKEKAIGIAKSMNFKIEPLNVNTSGKVWEISDDGKTLIQPLTSIKGLGDSAMDQILMHRPFNTIEEFLFHDDVVYSKLNKKALDVLCLAGALKPLQDDRFSGDKHFWTCVAVDRPRKPQKLIDNIELYEPEGEFTVEEKIESLSALTGVFPIRMIVSEETQDNLLESGIPTISEFDPALKICWFVPRRVNQRKTKNDKTYYVLDVVDSNNVITTIRCWGVNPDKDHVQTNRVYIAKLDYNEQWGFSTRSLYHNFRVI